MLRQANEAELSSVALIDTSDYRCGMKFFVWWKGDDGGKVDIGPYSLANAIALAEDYAERGDFLYITDETGRRLTLKAALQLKAGADTQRF